MKSIIIAISLIMVSVLPLIAQETEMLFLVMQDGQYGYINKKGEIKIEPQFEVARSFSEGLAVVGIDDRFGYIDMTGKLVIPAEFDEVKDFSEGLAAVTKIARTGFINKKGAWVIDKYFYMPLSNLRYKEGMCAIKVGDNYGYWDKTGKTVIDYKYDYASDFSEGLAKVRIRKGYQEKYGFIDKKGKVVIPIEYDMVLDFSEGLARFWNEEWDYDMNDYVYWYGYINTKGEVVIAPNYEEAYNFKHGIAQVEVDGKIGYIDTLGNYIWNPTD